MKYNWKHGIRKLCCLLLGLMVVQAFAQQKLEFRQEKNYHYMMRVDVEANKLVRSADERLVPWLPRNQFGWHIQDQNYFNLFFDRRDGGRPLPNIDFLDQVVLAIVKYDIHPWELNVEAVNYNPRKHHIHLVFTGQPLYHRSVAKQTTTLLVFIKQNKKIQKNGSRSLTFSAEQRGEEPTFYANDGSNAMKVFPLAFTAGLLGHSGGGNGVYLERYVQKPQSIAQGKTEALTEAQKARLKMEEEEERLAIEAREKAYQQQKLKEAQQFAHKGGNKQAQQPQVASDAELSGGSYTEDELLAAKEKALEMRRKELGLDASPAEKLPPRPETKTEEALTLQLNYTEPKGYMVRRDIELPPITYLVIRTKREWDEYLKTVPPGMTRITPISPEDFQTKLAVVIIKKGNSYWEMETRSVWQSGDELRVNIAAEQTRENLGWEATILYVAMVERGSYQRVSILQNGQKVKEISLN